VKKFEKDLMTFIVKKLHKNQKFCRSSTSFKNLNKFEKLKKKIEQFEKNW
jgi:hypothetical protein